MQPHDRGKRCKFCLWASESRGSCRFCEGKGFSTAQMLNQVSPHATHTGITIPRAAGTRAVWNSKAHTEPCGVLTPAPHRRPLCHRAPVLGSPSFTSSHSLLLNSRDPRTRRHLRDQGPRWPTRNGGPRSEVFGQGPQLLVTHGTGRCRAEPGPALKQCSTSLTGLCCEP